MQPVLEYIVRVFALALVESEQLQPQGEPDVKHRYLSGVAKLTMRGQHSQAVNKCIYE
ncbi:hypothetical protein [Azorhizophilus paspali]|uniref:Transposase n=1 Tax=Azorhizophilus paspali TaxID=69963 RepID=A0ABV6SHS8_AZOPA